MKDHFQRVTHTHNSSGKLKPLLEEENTEKKQQQGKMSVSVSVLCGPAGHLSALVLK